MKSKTNKFLVVMAIVAYWLGQSNASAFYDPGTQRWLNRDPAGENSDVNLYRFIYNEIGSYVDADGYCGLGIVGSGSAETGVIFGAGGTGAIGGGVFWGQGGNAGGFASAGAFAGGPGLHASFPSGQTQQPPDVGGAFAGVGAGPFFTNANRASQLRGPFSQWNFNIGIGPFKVSFSFAKSGNIWIASATFGPGAGISGSGYPTTCAATP